MVSKTTRDVFTSTGLILLAFATPAAANQATNHTAASLPKVSCPAEGTSNPIVMIIQRLQDETLTTIKTKIFYERKSKQYSTQTDALIENNGASKRITTNKKVWDLALTTNLKPVDPKSSSDAADVALTATPLQLRNALGYCLGKIMTKELKIMGLE